MSFHAPWMFGLFIFVPVLIYFWFRKGRSAKLRFSSVDEVQNCPVPLRVRLRPVLLILRIAAFSVFIIAMARPRKGVGISSITTEGVAMQIVVDRSGSMREEMVYEGNRMNRLEAVKQVLDEFIGGSDEFAGRHNDLLGLITFARYADTVCPLIHGSDVLLEFLNKTEIVPVQLQETEDGTAIGDALALAAARLELAEKELQERNRKLLTKGWSPEDIQREGFKIKSKVIVLLTDGQNNAGQRNPQEAAQYAKEKGIKIYTIGIGSKTNPRDMFSLLRRTGVDERLLKAIAEFTGAFYGRADDGQQLREIYQKIDELEKTEVKSIEFTNYSEEFVPWALAGLCLLGLEIFASSTVFRKIP